jgi:two-component system, response regulator
MNERALEVLLVEDDPNDVELTMHAFHKQNLANVIHVVRDGQEALDFLFAEGAYASRDVRTPPRVVLLDLKLPLVDGIEVLRRLRGDARTRAIPVVVLTSSREEQDIVATYDLGVNSYIVKPVDFQRFGDAVREVGMYWLLLNEPPRAQGALP